VTRAWLVALAVAASAAACATVTPILLPAGPWVPDAGGQAITAAAMSACRGVRRLTAEVVVRGQVGGAKIRGRVLAGFERGGALRLEAPAPFGAPIFVLASRQNRAVLWLPRDHRVVRDAPVEDVLDAIAGLRQTSDDLLSLLTGCLTAAGPAAAGDVRRNAQGVLMTTLQDGTVAYLQRTGTDWRLTAGTRESRADGQSWSVSYADFSTAFPATIRMWRTAQPVSGEPLRSALVLQVSQMETNVSLESRAFDIAVPTDAVPMTLEELRQAGPLADRAGGRGTAP
jgi:hypothetical protein